ncbi:TPA: fimbria/pilus outer membrane usher protein [Klebsiella oxytoca]
MYKHSPVLTILLISFSTNAIAEDYFDPSLLEADFVNNEKIDLSIFSRPGGGLEGEREVSIYVNDSFYTRDTLFFKNGSSGSLEPEFPKVFFDRLLAQQYLPNSSENYISTEEFVKQVPYSVVKFEQATSRIDIIVPQAYLVSDINMKSDPQSWNKGVNSLLIDYQLSGNKNRTHTNSTKNIYANSDVGVNVAGFRFRTSLNYMSFSTESLDNKVNKDSLKFYSTYLERDIGELRSTLRLGEQNTRGMILDSFNFIGGKIFSNDEMLSDRLRNYTPTIRGIANSQAIVTVTQNDRIILQKNVPPGPFELSDYSLSGYSGDLHVRIKETDGSEHGFIQPFSTLPEMKREGVYGYEISVGHYDNSGADKYYSNTPFMYGAWSRGFNHGVTSYAETVQSEKYQLIGVGSTLSLGEYGAVSGDWSVSRAEKNNKNHTGQSYGFKFSKNKIDTGTTVTLATYRYSTKDFYSFNDYVSKSDNENYFQENKLRNRISLNISQSLWDYGSLSLSASQQDYWSGGIKSRTAALSHNFGWNRVYFSTSMSLDQATRKNGRQSNNKAWGIYANIPFKNIIGDRDKTNSTLSYGSYKTNHNIQNIVTLTGAVPETKTQYRLSTGWGNVKQNSNKSISLNWDGDMVKGAAGYTSSGNSKIVDYNMSGSAVFYPWKLALGADRVINGAAIVETEGVSGIKVRQGGETSLFGTAILTSIQPYTENRFDIEAQDLPDDVVVSNTSKTIIPEKGSIIPIKYKIYKGKQVVFNLKQNNGTSLPFGAVVSLIDVDNENTGIVDDEGRVYLAGLPQKGKLRSTWGYNKSCEVAYDLKEERKEKSEVIIEYQGICK